MIRLLTGLLGTPSHETTKIVGWRLRFGVDVAVNRDARAAGRNFPVGVWVPLTAAGEACDCEKSTYDADRPRSSNLAPLTSLTQGRPAMLFKVRTPEELGRVIHAIETDRMASE